MAGRNLYALAWMEYEDVSYKALRMVSEVRDEYAGELASRAAGFGGSDPPRRDIAQRHLAELYRAVLAGPGYNLEQALHELIGDDWRSVCEGAKAASDEERRRYGE